MHTADILVIGAGIAGASAAYELAARARTIVLEREEQPGYHSTGRSAAMFIETYGNATMRALAAASRSFLRAPPAGFAATPILTPRGAVTVARADRRAALERSYAELRERVPTLQLWSGAQLRARVPCFTPAQVDAAIWEPEAMDIDVHALHQGYLRGLRERGAQLVCRAEVEAVDRRHGTWQVHTRAGRFAAPILVNAAGAWADAVGALAGAAPLGLVPKRRTAITFDPPPGADIRDWPAVIDVDEQWYFKPDAGRLLASPADETPSPPCDARPDEYDIAVLADRLAAVSTLPVTRIRSRWAGLRSFVADKTIVVGFDGRAPGFFWLAGQGGYGIQTAPAVAQAAAGLMLDGGLPAALSEFGLTAAALGPQRLRA